MPVEILRWISGICPVWKKSTICLSKTGRMPRRPVAALVQQYQQGRTDHLFVDGRVWKSGLLGNDHGSVERFNLLIAQTSILQRTDTGY